MKKYISFGLGLLLLGGAVLPFTNASRDAYQAYLYQQAKEKRSESERLYRPFSASQRKRPVYSTTKSVSQGARYAFRGEANDMARGAISQTPSKFRATTSRVAPVRPANVTKRISYQPVKIQSLNTELTTYVNNEFSLQIPTGWAFDHEGKKTLLGVNESGVSVTVQKVEGGCQSTSFMACSIALSKDLNHENLEEESPAEKILATHTVNRLGQKWNAFKDSREQTQTVTESFTGLVGSTEFYISRYYVQDSNESDVFIVEVRMPVQNTAKKMELIRSMFGSFRILQTIK